MKYSLSEKEIFPFRPKPFYFITTSEKDALSYNEVKQSLTELKEGGFGGIVLFNKPPKGFTPDQYLSEDWFDMVKTFCKVCHELDLVIWLNDGFDFPPGSVAGKIEAIDDTLKQLHLSLDENGEIKVLEADWGFPAFENPRSSELFIELVYKRYLKEVGEYFGNTIAYYAMFYDIKHVIIMGRVTSGEGGTILLARAKEVLEKEYPLLAKTIELHIPDEKSRRVGQSVAAASLPKI